MKYVKLIWPAALMIGLIYLLNNPLGPAPALGKLLSPFTGFLQNNVRNEDLSGNLDFPELKDQVIVKYDENRVPHIFAKNDHDLYFAQGYIMATERLWQMEFYTLVAAGRLTEVVGERALEYDRYNRKAGMAKAAEDITAKLEKNPLAMEILNAYSAGINAYMSKLSDKDLPIEYKILSYKPEPWSPLKSMLMLMNMRNTLNGGSFDYKLTNMVKKFGLDVVNDLFPDYPTLESPIIPTGTAWNFDALPTPDVPDQIMAFTDDGAVASNLETPKADIGSNNWAVAGSKSATGLPILANDPHLGLTLPSIWYQMQLNSDQQNVYGACLPGVPGVVIGFNKDIAWGVTNVGSDVMDFYKIKFKDASRNEYFHDGKWKKTTRKIEVYNIKGFPSVSDTVVYTHHGPVIYNEESDKNYSKQAPAGYAMRWITHESDESDMFCFYYLNRAKNYDDYRKALTYYTAPAQNFIFASNGNDIAITPNGKFPLKWKDQGKYLLDGTRADHDWQGWIPKDQNPTVKNPPRGFVSSANQFSTDPSYPYYLDWRFAESYRGTHINDRLTQMENATVDSLRSIQNDNYNLAAERFLPVLLPYLESDSVKVNMGALKSLQTWNKINDAESISASIFERWIDQLMISIWNDEFPAADNLTYPTEDRTLRLLKESPESKWFDDINSKDKVETIGNTIVNSFNKTIDSMTVEFGPMSEKWQWWKVKSTDIKHLVPAFTAFSRNDIKSGGGKRIVNATTETHGPSWRMIVQLDKEWPKAYGLYPGGQSGNVGNKKYDNMIDHWANGELFELLFLKNADEKNDRIGGVLTLTPKK